MGAPQTWNRYAYALNNPLRLVDPSGMMAEETDEGQQPWLSWLSYKSVDQDYGAVMATSAVMEKFAPCKGHLRVSGKWLAESKVHRRIEAPPL